MKQESLIEETLNCITHGLGVGLSIVGLILLVSYAIHEGDLTRIVGFSIYGVSLVLLYLASTFYHGAKTERNKRILRIFDHSAIYLLIAGTYTPFGLITVQETMGYVLLFILWGIAAAGILFKIFFVDRYESFSTFLYLGMSWSLLFVIKPFFDHISIYGFTLLLLGGFFYSSGVIFFMLDRMPFNHVIWHLFVMCGSACHFLSLFLYVLPTS